MYCSSCGTSMGGVRMRCPHCHSFTPAFWLNLYSLAILLIILESEGFYLWKMIPVMAHLGHGLGTALPPVLRLNIRLATLVGSWWGLGVLLVVVGALLVLRWRRVALPDWLASGGTLAVVTWLALATTQAGLFAGFIWLLTWIPPLR